MHFTTKVIYSCSHRMVIYYTFHCKSHEFIFMPYGFLLFKCKLSLLKYTFISTWFHVTNYFIRVRSQTLVRGAWCKKIYRENFSGPPFRPQKKFQAPPFCHENYGSTPIEKHVNSIFTGKFVVIFFRAPLTRVKNFKSPPFCIRPPLQVFVNGPLYDIFGRQQHLLNKFFFFFKGSRSTKLGY